MRQDKKLQLLETLHTVLIENLLDKVKSGEAKAGDLNVARQLLKDNGIECIPQRRVLWKISCQTFQTLM